MAKGKKQRGIWLTSILLVLIVIQSLGILNNSYFFSRQPGGLMNFYALKTMILALIQLIGLILIFKWRKLGAYLYLSVCLISVVTGFITSSNFILGAIINMVVYLIILDILYYLISPIWNSME